MQNKSMKYKATHTFQRTVNVMPLASLAAAETLPSSSLSSLLSCVVLALDLPAPAASGLALMFSGPDVGPVKYMSHSSSLLSPPSQHCADVITTRTVVAVNRRHYCRRHHNTVPASLQPAP